MKSKFLSIVLISLVILLTIVSFFLWNKNIELIKDRDETNSIAEKLHKEYDILFEKYAKLESDYSKTQMLNPNVVDLSSTHINRMKKKGLNNPVQNLIQNLKSHPELIPEKGTLGGTMGFYFDEKIWILTNKWVLAYFEDGHTGGYLLLQYDVRSDGTINWKRISSHTS